MNNNPLLDSTVYWNMTLADYCRFHDAWQCVQPYVRTTLRPSKQEGKVVEARIGLCIPAEDGTDIIIKYNTKK